MDRAVRQWAHEAELNLDDVAMAALTRKLSKAYTIYGSMLLLPPGTIDGPDFEQLYQKHRGLDVELYKHIAKQLKVTNIAINRPIPLHNDACQDRSENVMRAPINFQPMYGNFGPSTCAVTVTAKDFQEAYWVTAKQNGIAQTWAPRWTMFSRGNITEKARVLELPSVAEAVMKGARSGRGCSAIDLYAGIGYFTFSYVKAGVSKVLCWELNGWSCEGLRRGAKANRWRVANLSNLDELAVDSADRIILFNESNEHAIERVAGLRNHIPPVRHVNCGLLPTSQPSWQIAFACLDPELGGWVHVHENFAASEIEAKANNVRDAFQSYLEQSDGRTIVLESINQVKTYAPSVWHCVIDLMVPPVLRSTA